MNANLLKEEQLVTKWKRIANNLTDPNDALKEKLDTEKNITEHRVAELVGRDAFRRWNDLLGIVKASAIEYTREKDKAYKEKKENLLSREEINNLNKEELDDILEEIDRQELDKIKIKTELKNYEMNSTNKRLTKHKSLMEGQSRRIKKITIDGKSLTNSDKIKEGIQRYYKFQFRCQCKNEKKPRPCAICKSNPVHYAKVAEKNFKKKSHKQKRITTGQKNKLEQKISMHEVDEYVLRKLKIKLKSPGPDGIPYEFFNVLWKEIRMLVFRIIDWVFTTKKNARSSTGGVDSFLTEERER